MKKVLFNLLPAPIKNWVRILFLGKLPGDETSQGVSIRDWDQRQVNTELSYWLDQYLEKVGERDPRDYYHETYHKINVEMFADLSLDCEARRVVDLGCGPFGSLPLKNYSMFIGIEPLAAQFHEKFQYPSDWLVLNTVGENIPLLSESVDTVYCINALDHFYDPYSALREAIRILKKGGYLVLSTDIGGTPGHPCKVLEKDLDAVLVKSGHFKVIERKSSTDKQSSWPAELQIPLFVFQGMKLG